MTSGIYILKQEQLQCSILLIAKPRDHGPTLEEAWSDHAIRITIAIRGITKGGALVGARHPPIVLTCLFLTLSAMLYLLSSYNAHVFLGVLLKDKLNCCWRMRYSRELHIHCSPAGRGCNKIFAKGNIACISHITIYTNL